MSVVGSGDTTRYQIAGLNSAQENVSQSSIFIVSVLVLASVFSVCTLTHTDLRMDGRSILHRRSISFLWHWDLTSVSCLGIIETTVQSIITEYRLLDKKLTDMICWRWGLIKGEGQGCTSRDEFLLYWKLLPMEHRNSQRWRCIFLLMRGHMEQLNGSLDSPFFILTLHFCSATVSDHLKRSTFLSIS